MQRQRRDRQIQKPIVPRLESLWFGRGINRAAHPVKVTEWRVRRGRDGDCGALHQKAKEEEGNLICLNSYSQMLNIISQASWEMIAPSTKYLDWSSSGFVVFTIIVLFNFLRIMEGVSGIYFTSMIDSPWQLFLISLLSFRRFWIKSD